MLIIQVKLMRTENEIQTRIDELEKKQRRTDSDEDWDEWNTEILILKWVLNKKSN